MAIEASAAVRQMFFVLTGMVSPGGNEDMMRVAATAVRGAGTRVGTELPPKVEELTQNVLATLDSRVSPEFARTMSAFSGSGGVFAAIQAGLWSLGDATDETADSFVEMKVTQRPARRPGGPGRRGTGELPRFHDRSAPAGQETGSRGRTARGGGRGCGRGGRGGRAGRGPADGVELPFAFIPLGPSGRAERDAMDQAVAAVAEGHGAAGVWRSWRYRLDDPGIAAGRATATVTVDPDDPQQAHRVYIVQVWENSVSQSLCRDLLRAIADTGRAGAEVIPLSDEPPPYQGQALAESLLLWASQGEPDFALAEVFDFVDPVSGPGFASDHATIEDRLERERLLEYLRGGVLVLATAAVADDVLGPAAGAVVAGSFRTDGEWIWTDAAEYYLRRHHLAPEPRLTAHLRRKLFAGEVTSQVDDETVAQAADFLLRAYQRFLPPGFSPRDAVAGNADLDDMFEDARRQADEMRANRKPH